MTPSRAKRARLALCGAIAWLHAFAPHAVADDSLQLAWQAPSECPSRAWVLSRVQRYLDAGVDMQASAQLRVEVEVRQEAGVMRARASIRSPYGEHGRSFGDPSCVVVADVAAFVIAQAIDPHVRADKAPLTDADIAEAQRTSPRASADTAASGAPPGPESQSGEPGTDARSGSADASATDARDVSAPEQDATPEVPNEGDDAGEEADDAQDEQALPSPPSPPLHIGWAASLQAELAYGPLPKPGAGGVARASLLLGRLLRVELGVSYQLPQARALPSDSSVEARFDQLGGLLALCATFARADSELGVCGRALAALQRGRGDELSAGRNDTGPYLALSVVPVLLQRITGALWGRFELGPLLPVVWPRFKVDEASGTTVVHEPKGIGFFAALGGEWRFD